jgi:uncharacterized protein
MLIEFSVENFLSFNERVTLSLVAAPELDETDGLLGNTFEAPGGIRLLKSALVFGANASGKSNLLEAMDFARKFAFGSAKETQAGEPIKVTPFLLGPGSAERGSSFELVFIENNERYRYAFSVDRSHVLSEVLSRGDPERGTEVELFRRDADSIRVGKRFAEGRGVESKTRSNALFLSVVGQLNGKESRKILNWFTFNGLAYASGVEDESLLKFTTNKVRAGEWTEEIVRLAREADLGITGISAPDMFADALNVRHRSFDLAGQPTGEADFRLDEESDGTQKFIALAGPLLFVLKNATALLLDELDARLHPRLTRAVVNLFHTDSNPNNAQLVAATHDTNLLDRRLVRRDQIWFAEKDPRGATKLYSLAEFDLPPEARYERDYLLGKYGAVPVIGELVQPEPAK